MIISAVKSDISLIFIKNIYITHIMDIVKINKTRKKIWNSNKSFSFLDFKIKLCYTCYK